MGGWGDAAGLEPYRPKQGHPLDNLLLFPLSKFLFSKPFQDTTKFVLNLPTGASKAVLESS